MFFPEPLIQARNKKKMSSVCFSPPSALHPGIFLLHCPHTSLTQVWSLCDLYDFILPSICGPSSVWEANKKITSHTITHLACIVEEKVLGIPSLIMNLCRAAAHSAAPTEHAGLPECEERSPAPGSPDSANSRPCCMLGVFLTDGPRLKRPSENACGT